jgi:hypothetical protein
MKSSNDGPSASGYHFVQAYQNCKRKFYHQYIQGLEENYRAPAILFGTAGHVGMEEWYRQHAQQSPISKKVKFATDAAIADAESRRDQYYDLSKLEVHKRQLKDTFHQYGLVYPDEPFKVVSIEENYEVTLDYGDIFTGRIDLVTLRNNGQLMIMDHKFTGWSLESFKRSVQASDQATAYCMLWNEHNPKRRAGGVIFNLIRNYQGRIEFAQVPVYRAQQDIDTFRREVSENLRDMAQRVIDPEATWPKNTDHCFAYNRACPFLELCQGVKFDGLIGTKYHKKENS